jgi:predicted kinase
MCNVSEIYNIIRTNKKVLYILCGLPYAGKSYFVNSLTDKTNISVVSIDKIFNNNGFDWNNNNLPSSTEWERIFEESYQIVRAKLTMGENVLYDSTNHTKVSRDMLRAVASTVGASTCVIYVKTPIDEIWKRWEENELSKSRPQVSRELVQMTIDMFEEPDESENRITLQN